MFSLIFALNKRLSKQSQGWWFETPSLSLWCHWNARHMCNGITKDISRLHGRVIWCILWDKVWHMFYLCHLYVVCNIVLHWTMSKWGRLYLILMYRNKLVLFVDHYLETVHGNLPTLCLESCQLCTSPWYCFFHAKRTQSSTCVGLQRHNSEICRIYLWYFMHICT